MRVCVHACECVLCGYLTICFFAFVVYFAVGDAVHIRQQIRNENVAAHGRGTTKRRVFVASPLHQGIITCISNYEISYISLFHHVLYHAYYHYGIQNTT